MYGEVEAERATVQGAGGEGLSSLPDARRRFAGEGTAGRAFCSGKRCPFALVDSRLDLVGKLAERAKKVSDGILVRIVDEGAVARIAGVIQRHVTDPMALTAIREELEQIGRALPRRSRQHFGRVW